ncbi:MAG: DedA family protein, partial [Chitinophagales bacterium]|nr:DedA family protein [Chitinophagales bacterium]
MNSEQLIHYGGLTLIVIVVFIETGLFFGFFLPGDYLLFTAGLLCGTNDLNVELLTLLIAVTVAAIAGDFTGYTTGRVAG